MSLLTATTSTDEQMLAQAARILEQLQVLDAQYGPAIAASHPDLAGSLSECAAVLLRVLGTTHTSR